MASGDDPLRTVSESRYWHLLLHYHPRISGGVVGESDDPSFYLSPKGKTDPLKELNADIENFRGALTTDGPPKQHAQCRFPERYRFLKAELNLDIQDVDCKDFKEWKDRLDARAITLVFASAYINNPTSMFGHTFLRVDSRRTSKGDESNRLLSYAVSYGMDAADASTLSVVVFGVIGGYDGVFSVTPYFEKINEYNEGDDRDLWEYELNLTQEQIDRMTAHLWEIHSTRFPYYFFNKNCSSQLLSLLEVANPAWHLSDQFFYWVVPSDTLRSVGRLQGGVSRVSMRPSLFKKLQANTSQFSLMEAGDFDRAVDKDLVITGQESPAVLDALIDFQTHQMMKAKTLLDEPGQDKRRSILLARARNEKTVLPEVVEPMGSRPDHGSDSRKISTYGGARAGAGYFGLEFRPALHDLLDWDEGYVPNSRIEIGKTDLRFTTATSSIHLHQLDLINISSLSPLNRLNKGLSWDGSVGAFSPEDLFCHDCLAARAYAGVGASATISSGPRPTLLYALMKGNLQYSGFFYDAFRVGPSLNSGVIVSAPFHFKARLDAEIFYFPTQTSDFRSFTKIGLETSWQPLHDIEFRWLSNDYLRKSGHFIDHQGLVSWYF